MAHIIVVGNEKGGAGKSTVSIHVATALVRSGHRVVCLDLDLRQKSFTRYVHNRQAFLEEAGLVLAVPEIAELRELSAGDLEPGQTLEDQRLYAALEQLGPAADFILIDCPGSHTRLSQVAHAVSDTLITPLNDSFIDFDLLAQIDSSGTKIKGPSIYSEMVWAARQARAEAKMAPIDWVVLRNRIGSQRMLNKEKMTTAVEMLSKRIGFRVAPGFSERVVFRELFPRGLTLLDLRDVGIKQLSISNIAARQELRDMMKALNLPGVTLDF